MASGSTGRSSNPGAKGFDFGSDDILCSYEDYGHQDGFNGTGHSDPPVTASNSTKEFHKSGMARNSAFPSASYSPPEESSLNQDLVLTVERTMKKYTDNIMRFLEGISSRMSQLELYCYNLDKTIGEMRSELVRDHGEADSKLKSLEKHMQEVHRSVQILRDKQELADTQKELAKLHVQKESSSANSSHQSQDRPTVVASDTKSSDTSPDNQLALALPNQVLPQAPVPSRPVEQQPQPHIAPALPIQSMGQSQGTYYLSQAPPSNVLSPAQPSHGQYLSANSQFQASQMQDPSRAPPQTAQTQVHQSSQVQLLTPYQHQWTQQLPQQVQQGQQQLPQQGQQQLPQQGQQQLPQQGQQQLPQQGQQAAMQSQMRPSSSPVYSSYVSSNQANPTPEGVPNNMPIQMQFSGMAQSTSTRLEAGPYGYGTAGRPVQAQLQTQHMKPTYASGGDVYVSNGPHPTFTPGNAYVIYDEGGRGSHHPGQPPHFSQSGYPPTSMPNPNIQPPPGPNVLRPSPPPPSRNNPYGELIEKLLSMGYRGDHVVGAIQRLEESGQQVDFNAVLDRLNGHTSSGGSQRGWSG